MKKLILFSILSFFYLKSMAQSGVILPNQGISVPQFTTVFINGMLTQPKGTVVFDKDLNLMKYWDGTAWQSMSGGGGSSQWTTTGSNIFYNTGNVGIGLTSPTKSRFEVASPNANTAIFGSTSTGISLQQNYPTIGFNQYRDASNVQRYIGTGFAMGNFMYPVNGSMYWNAIPSGTAGNPTTSETTLMTLTQDAKLGINTGASAINANLFVVKGPNTFDGTAVFKGTTHFTHFNYGSFEDTYIRGGKDYSYVIINDIPGGKVGIGVVPSLYTLEVNGTTRSKEVIVETGWADYVFDEKYKLRSIDEMEAFVKENKHLPNIPKASDIETNGLKVGETNKAMMEKIEELALYIIQLKKEIDILKARN